jgi:hypothetical protein
VDAVSRGAEACLSFHDGEDSVEKNMSKAQAAPTGLLSPMSAGTNAGSPLFVINLCASIAPVQVDSKNIPGLDNYRLYQVARVEDGRTRHRLRLGFFTSESHAESVLAVVRQQYPTAFTACLCDEDKKFTRGYLPASHANGHMNGSHANGSSAKPANGTAAAKPALSESEIIELTWEPDEKPKATAQPAPAPAAARAPAPAPKKPMVSADAGLDEFTWEPPALQASVAKVAASTSDTSKQPVIRPALNIKPVIKAAIPAIKAATSPPKPATPAKPATPPKPVAAAPTPKPAPKVDTATSMRVPALQLSLSTPQAPAAPQTKSAGPAQPFHVGKGVHIAETGISLQAEPAKAAPPAAKAPTVAAPKVNGAADKAKVTPSKAAPVRPGPGARLSPPAHKPSQVIPPVTSAAHHAPHAPAAPSSSYVPELDSTQTIRALTNAELNDEQQEKWFAVQLAASEQPVNLDAMPRLDIFEAYRLYSVATAGSGKIIHSLRLGFFKEAVSAEAVMGYLKTFFGSPTVLRVSVAEHARFKDAPVKKASSEKHEAKVVELNNARATRPVVPTVTVEVDAPAVDTAATGTFKMNSTGSFKVDATGTHKALKSAAKGGGPATKRSAPPSRTRTGNTGKHKVITAARKSLAEELLDEAREVELSASGIRKLPKNDSLLSRLVDKLKK